jgi:hypothetical protein
MWLSPESVRSAAGLASSGQKSPSIEVTRIANPDVEVPSPRTMPMSVTPSAYPCLAPWARTAQR